MRLNNKKINLSVIRRNSQRRIAQRESTRLITEGPVDQNDVLLI